MAAMAVRFRAPIRAALASLLVAATAQAFVPHSGPRFAADTLTALPAAGVAKPLRVQEHVLWGQAAPPASWLAFQAVNGGQWQAAWDAATGVPTRIWGSGIAVPGANADPAIAEAAARRVLAAHLDLLAPGASISDFVLVSNVTDGDIRALGFVQYAGGMRVLGGQVSFEFKRDRLFVIGSEALPDVTVPVARAHLATPELAARAAASVRATVGLPAAPVTALGGGDVILPLLADDAVLGYRVVAPYELDGGAEGRYRAYADVGTGDIVAVQQMNDYATGTVLYRGVDRYPGRGYANRPAPGAHETVNGSAATTAGDGTVAWSPDSTVPIQLTAIGDLVTIVNKQANGAAATTTGSIAPGGQIVWDTTGEDPKVEQFDEAQVDAYLDTNIAKAYVRANLDPAMPTIDDAMTVNVNIDQTCNAFFDGKNLNFFAASDPMTTKCSNSPGSGNPCCENTARIQDVNFHEYGHRVHTAEIIMGVGDFDAAMSEGAADFLAASITGDHGMGRGFFFTDDPLRDLDPPDHEWTWPDDIQEIHHTGMIFSGTFWDLRKAAIAAYGQDAGVALTNKLYLGALRRSINIPTSLIEALATDDDDGDLSNGTPHECLIRDAFGAHGLRTATGHVEAPGALAENANAIGVIIDVTGLSGKCASDQVASAQLSWRPPFSGVPAPGSVMATAAGPNRFFAELPLSPHDSVSYTVQVTFSDGSHLELADNLADQYYQLYDGYAVPLYCTTFEDGDPLQHGWTAHDADGSMPSWAWTMPSGGATNPHAAYSGTHIMAQAPGMDYAPNLNTWLQLPDLDVGPYTNVRLQYRRWLAVEDSHFDQARIEANGKTAWLNYTQNMGDSSSIAHLDKEWRFHDVPLSGYFTGHTLQLAWHLKSDAGLQYAGWSLDDVCVVADPTSICGDGVRSEYEECDNGSSNADKPDQCRTWCRLPTCGDGIVDSQEECDDGPAGSKTCTSKCTAIPPAPGGGCCSAAGGGGSSLWLAAVLAGLLARRRRGV